MDNDAALARFGVRGSQFHDLLTAIRTMEQKARSVFRPLDPIDVVTNDVVIERFSVPNFHLNLLLCIHIVNVKVHDGIGSSDLWIRFRVQRVLNFGLIVLEIVFGNFALIETIVGNLLTIGRPPHCGDLAELFTIDPACASIFCAIGVVSFRCHVNLVSAERVAQPQVSVPVECLELAVR